MLAKFTEKIAKSKLEVKPIGTKLVLIDPDVKTYLKQL